MHLFLKVHIIHKFFGEDVSFFNLRIFAINFLGIFGVFPISRVERCIAPPQRMSFKCGKLCFFLDKKNPDEVLGCFFSYRFNHKWGLHKVDGGSGLRYSVLFHVFVTSEWKQWFFFVAFCFACFASDLSTLPARCFRPDLKCDSSFHIDLLSLNHLFSSQISNFKSINI